MRETERSLAGAESYRRDGRVLSVQVAQPMPRRGAPRRRMNKTTEQEEHVFV